MRMRNCTAAIVAWAVIFLAAAPLARGQDDTYEKYVKTSKDFKAVKQDKDWALKAFPSWVYMPWQTLGKDDATAAYYAKVGWNAQTIDFRGGTGALSWIEQHKLDWQKYE